MKHEKRHIFGSNRIGSLQASMMSSPNNNRKKQTVIS